MSQSWHHGHGHASISSELPTTNGARIMDCERIRITGRDLREHLLFDFPVPAYTRTLRSFTVAVDVAKSDYLEGAEVEGRKVSVADFALFLLARAAVEPQQQETDDDVF